MLRKRFSRLARSPLYAAVLVLCTLLLTRFDTGQEARAAHAQGAALCLGEDIVVQSGRVLCPDGTWYPLDPWPGSRRLGRLLLVLVCGVLVGRVAVCWVLPWSVVSWEARSLPPAAARTLADVDVARPGGGLWEGPGVQSIDFVDGHEWHSVVWERQRIVRETRGCGEARVDALGVAQIGKRVDIARVRPEDFDALWHAAICARVQAPVEEIRA